MKVKLYEILELDSFQSVKVVAGAEGLRNNVENVYVMEVPDIASYIDKDGLLFTTLFPIMEDKEAMENFILELINHGLAGVAIKLGRYIESIPQFMLEQAERYSFPILMLPPSANFSLLSNDILTKLLGMKTRELEFRENISNKLHNLLLSGANINELVLYVSQLTNMDIVIVSNQLKYIESSLIEEPESFELFEQNFYETIKVGSEAKENELCFIFEGKKYHKKDLIIHSIDAGKKRMGYLIVLKKEKERMLYLDVVIEQAIILLAFLLQNRQSLIQTEQNYLDNFIRSIIHTQYTSQTELIQKAKVFKWNIHFPTIILLIDIENDNQKIKLNNYYKALDSGAVTETIARICEIPTDHCKAALYNNQIICFVSVALINDLSNKLKTASEIFSSYLSRFGLVNVGISDKIYSMLEIPQAYEEADLVQKIYKDVYRGQPFIEFYKNLGIYKLFHSIDDKKELRNYVEEKLGSILESDQKNEMELIKTLQHLIKHNMNMKKSAEDMFIHYNSLRYRVNKLKELGVEITNGNDMTEIAVALQLLKYLNYPI